VSSAASQWFRNTTSSRISPESEGCVRKWHVCSAGLSRAGLRGMKRRVRVRVVAKPGAEIWRVGREGEDGSRVSERVSERRIHEVLCSGCWNICSSAARKEEGLLEKWAVRMGVHVCGVFVWSRAWRGGGCGGGGAVMVVSGMDGILRAHDRPPIHRVRSDSSGIIEQAKCCR